MTTRCGSYPFMNIADDFGLPYGDVLLFASCRGIRDEARSAHQKNAVWRVIGALDIDNIAAFDARVSDVRRRDRPAAATGWSVADAVAGNGEEDVGKDVLAMSDEDLLRLSLSWFGLRAPVSGDELAFGWGWQRHVRRLLRAIVEHARKRGATETATPDTGGGLSEALEALKGLAHETLNAPTIGRSHGAGKRLAERISTLATTWCNGCRQPVVAKCGLSNCPVAALSDTPSTTPEAKPHG